MHARNAASVLPEPVGERISVCFRSAINGQPRCCGGLGSPNRRRNHAVVIGWKVGGNGGRSISEFLSNCCLRFPYKDQRVLSLKQEGEVIRRCAYFSIA
jgi:hypothetical protein